MALFLYSHPIARDQLQKPGKVQFGAKWNALLVRSDQVMQSYPDLKMHILHSACYTKAAYQISGQSGVRAQSNHCRYTNRLRAFNYFRYLHIETGIMKSFKVPAILFGTLRGDVLSVICAKYGWFSSRQVLKNALRSEVIQRSWHFHDLLLMVGL